MKKTEEITEKEMLETLKKTQTFHAQAANYHAMMYEEATKYINEKEELCDSEKKEDSAKNHVTEENDEKEDIPSPEVVSDSNQMSILDLQDLDDPEDSRN